MKEISSGNFGPLIAFLLPGFAALWALSYFSPVLRSWLVGTDAAGPTVGGFLYVTLASVAAGLTVSTVRWAVIDTIHHWTGLRQPTWDFSRLRDRVAAYNVLHEIHYKHYQFAANMLISLFFVYVSRRIHLGFFEASFGSFDLACLVLAVILFAGSRDTLRRFYSRVNGLLGAEFDGADRDHTAPASEPTTSPAASQESA